MSLFALQARFYHTTPLQKFTSRAETTMDEYLFIELAKLQADRRRLEREEHEQLQRSQSDEPKSNSTPREPLRSRWFANQWSKQS